MEPTPRAAARSGTSCTISAARVTEAHRALRESQTGQPLGSLEANFAFLDFGAIRQWEERYLPNRADGDKYAGSLGWQPAEFRVEGGGATRP